MPVFQPDLPYYFKCMFKGINIESYKPLLSEFYYNNIVNNLCYEIENKKIYCDTCLYDFKFIQECFPCNDYFYSVFIIVYNNKFISFAIFSLVIYLMQKTSEIVCSDFSL